MGEEPTPGAEDNPGGPVARGLASSIADNSSAFGFSIMITVTFGVLSEIAGSPTAGQLVIFGVAAALAVAVLAAIQSRGFRVRAGNVPPEVSMLGTAQNFLSVALAVGVALGLVELLKGTVAWAVTPYVVVTIYILAESLAIAVSERVQRRRGDHDAGAWRE
jgi:4-amino-4-deoxy-L-arabinose transferase-like glycosyltransferase